MGPGKHLVVKIGVKADDFKAISIIYILSYWIVLGVHMHAWQKCSHLCAFI